MRPQALRGGRVARPSASNDPHDGTHAGTCDWQVLCLCEVANFPMLRRHLGRARADLLTSDVASQINALFPDMRLAPIGRSLIEIAFERATPEEAAADIDAVRKLFLRPT